MTYRGRVGRTILATTACIGASLLLAAPAGAYWHSIGAGSGSATTSTLAPPTAVTVAPSSMSSVTISWTPPSSAPTPSGYYVTRLHATTPTAACNTTPTILVATASCIDSAMPDGTYTYVVTAVYRSWSAASTASGSVVVLTATSLAFSLQPTSTTSSTSITPAVQVSVQSASGASVADANVAITVAIAANPVSGTMAGTLIELTNSAGVATFPGLSIDKAAAGYTIAASATGLTSATSSPFTISLGAPTKLAFVTSPTNSFAGWTFFAQPVVAIEHAGGNTVTTSTSTVTIALTTPGSATLSCTLSQAAAAGVASFAGCSIDKVAAYTLTARSGTLTNAVSASFDVIAAPTHLAWSGPATTVCAPSSGTNFALIYYDCSVLSRGTFTARVSLSDSSGNPIVNVAAAVTVTLTPIHGTVSSTTLTINHGQSTSLTSSTFSPAWPLLATTDTVTATAPALAQATAVLHPLFV